MATLTMDFAGQTGVEPRLGRLDAPENTYAEIITAGYINRIGGLVPNVNEKDFIFASYKDGHASFNASITDGLVTLVPAPQPGQIALIGAAVVGNLPKFQATSGDVEDSGIAADDVLTVDTDVTDCQQIVGINEILIASVATWTRTRIARGNYVLRKTAAANTSVIGIDITPMIRAAAGRGFELASVDVVYSIATDVLTAHTLTLDKIAYANNVAVAVTSVSLTGSLATATQANPYLTNIAVATPAFDNTDNSKYVLELTVNATATCAYDFYGLNLHFTKSVA